MIFKPGVGSRCGHCGGKLVDQMGHWSTRGYFVIGGKEAVVRTSCSECGRFEGFRPVNKKGGPKRGRLVKA